MGNNIVLVIAVHELSHVTINLSAWFATRLDTNRPAQPQRLARGWKFRIYKKAVLYYLGSEQLFPKQVVIQLPQIYKICH